MGAAQLSHRGPERDTHANSPKAQCGAVCWCRFDIEGWRKDERSGRWFCTGFYFSSLIPLAEGIIIQPPMITNAEVQARDECGSNQQPPPEAGRSSDLVKSYILTAA